jgi:hypothetical protein
MRESVDSNSCRGDCADCLRAGNVVTVGVENFEIEVTAIGHTICGDDIGFVLGEEAGGIPVVVECPSGVMKADCPETDLLPYAEANIFDEGRMINIFKFRAIAVHSFNATPKLAPPAV